MKTYEHLSQGGLNKKEIQLNFCKICSSLIFINSIFSSNGSQLRKTMARSYFYETKTLIWNKIMFGLSNLLNLAEMVEKDLVKSISKKRFSNITFSIRFITAYCKDFRSLSLKNKINFQKSLSVQLFVNHELPVADLLVRGELK